MPYSQMSMLDIAYQFVKENDDAVNFYTIYEHVCKCKEFEENEINARRSQFYTNITLDGRFITVGENNWDLRERHKFEDIHIDMNDIYADELDTDEEFDDALEDDDGTFDEDSFDDIDD